MQEEIKNPISKIIKNKNHITILIGPEGDFSIQEIEQAIAHNFTPVSLGESRLRTETAALLACCSVALRQ